MLDLKLTLHFPTGVTVARESADVMTDNGRDLEARIVRRWRIKTGRSRRGWRLVERGDAWQLLNPVDYSLFIKDGAELIDRSISIVTRQTAEQLADRLPRAVAAELSP